MTEQNRLLYQKGKKLFCLKCNSHVLTIAYDLFVGSSLSSACFTDEGQGPWKYVEQTLCRACGQAWFKNNFLHGRIE